MRGKLAEKGVSVSGLGITPAYAGKTELGVSQAGHGEDHPRVCGENLDSYGAWELPIGSPPRMRGKPAVFAYGGSQYRITPAYAGKTIIGVMCLMNL